MEWLRYVQKTYDYLLSFVYPIYHSVKTKGMLKSLLGEYPVEDKDRLSVDLSSIG